MAKIKIIQVETFNGYENGKEDCNEFLLHIPSEDVISVIPLYNTILGGIDFVVTYIK